MSTAGPLARRRRSSELQLGILAAVVITGGYVLTALADAPELPPRLWFFLAGVLGLFVVAHLAVRRLAPRADPTLLPIAILLNGVGWITVARLEAGKASGADAGAQAVWSAVAIGAFVVTLLAVRRTRTLERYRYTFLLLGLVALLLPLLPRIGVEINGARLWVDIGPIQFQPGEAAKVLLVVFFAAYLVDKRELIGFGDLRILGPLLVTWFVSLVVMIGEKDLGSSLLVFAVIATMLYIATGRATYLILSLAMFAAGAIVSYALFAHVQTRVSAWLDPWHDPQGSGYQVLQSIFSFGTGGFAGTGIGLGRPEALPAVESDLIFSAIGEELGFIGTLAVVIGFMLLVGSAFRVALAADRPFPKLFAAGLATVLGVQTFVILGGVTRLIPLTGVTLPFVSQGGSSLVANYVIIALLLRVSDESLARATQPGPRRTRVEALA